MRLAQACDPSITILKDCRELWLELGQQVFQQRKVMSMFVFDLSTIPLQGRRANDNKYNKCAGYPEH
ncbi:52c11433-bdbd-48fe-8c77-0c905d5cac37 [Thermothielavioides terrestris]|uniref:52c11433-bdbd-48fe-8c77-0c905d5cac37 n=1 Tax=Thermothielavioides terrestris TaxID=2587410 RepID=A0A3S4B607_9PEZI|nr:52c11433-bdbd-48fe-8c77-0c905d5cac37 [Thermothielavioides terrestris]